MNDLQNASPSTPAPMPSSSEARPPASEATKIEQSRAIAEVQGALVVAQNRPRDVSKAHAAIIESCGMDRLAERAFFSFPRGGKTVQGPTVHLARELARCWGNIDYGIKELSRDDDTGTSEMLAFAWDLETNTRAENIFIVPHRRTTQQGVRYITDVRDVYENNANMGARRVREMILGVLPPWLVEDAKATCRKTLEHGGGAPIERRRSLCIQSFEKQGVSREVLEAKIGKSMDLATALEVANLGVALRSLLDGELSRDDFLDGTEAAQLTEDLKADAPAPEPAEATPEPETPEPPAEQETATEPPQAEAPADLEAGDEMVTVLGECKTPDQLDAALARQLSGNPSAAVEKRIRGFAEKRRLAL